MEILKKMVLPQEFINIIEAKHSEVIIPKNRDHLVTLAMGGDTDALNYDVSYEVEGKGLVREVYISKCKNGLSVNYDDTYMRRRDPDATIVADDIPTDKEKYSERYGIDFENTRQETFEWLKKQDRLLVLPFYAGNDTMGLGYPALVIMPANAAFFATALADLQGFIPADEVPDSFKPNAIVYVAPPFRHTHYDGKQVVVHNRKEELHEIFSYNLYPGPSAKKGIYSVLLNIGEREKWITLHASTVKVVTPYELTITIAHEGASGGGKSEMIEPFHRERDGTLLLGTNIVTGEKTRLSVAEACELYPITDDMALAHPSLQNNSGKIVLTDAENGWFLRVNHITEYGTSPQIEKKTIHPDRPLIFLNMDAKPSSTCLLWEHIQDEPGKPCPNPRVVMPRSFVDNAISDPVEVDIRSFGLRQPPATKENPTYGIAGMFHVLPPALAWLWRLVAPRGHANPSITNSTGMQSEGVGSYWPFAIGKMVDQANLLLDQILGTLSTRYILIPNQYIGAYDVGFAGQWATREYLALRGGVKFKPDALKDARCPLLGYTPKSLKFYGVQISKEFLQTNLQPELGNDGYDAGAKMLVDFFKDELQKFNTPELSPLGKQIIEACMNDASVQEYYDLIPKL